MIKKVLYDSAGKDRKTTIVKLSKIVKQALKKRAADKNKAALKARLHYAMSQTQERFPQ